MDCSRIKTLLFDFGGTLDAPGVHWLTRFQWLYLEMGLDIGDDRIRDAFYWADREMLKHPGLSTMTYGPMVYHHVALQLRYLQLSPKRYQKSLAEGFRQVA